MEQSSYSKN